MERKHWIILAVGALLAACSSGGTGPDDQAPTEWSIPVTVHVDADSARVHKTRWYPVNNIYYAPPVGRADTLLSLTARRDDGDHPEVAFPMSVADADIFFVTDACEYGNFPPGVGPGQTTGAGLFGPSRVDLCR